MLANFTHYYVNYTQNTSKRFKEKMISSKEPAIDAPGMKNQQNIYTWEATKDAMHQILERYGDDRSIEHVKQVCEKLQSSILALVDVNKEIESDGDEICTEIDAKITECNENFSQEEKNLRAMVAHIDNLENEVNEIRYSVNEAKEEETEIQKKIILYNEQARERVEQLDEVELKKKEEVYRLQTQISLHAHVTGIKWDYDDVDSIKGEIDIPSRQIQRRFCIDPEGKSDFAIANKFWSMMEA